MRGGAHPVGEPAADAGQGGLGYLVVGTGVDQIRYQHGDLRSFLVFQPFIQPSRVSASCVSPAKRASLPADWRSA
jgi:hypothetical protein